MFYFIFISLLFNQYPKDFNIDKHNHLERYENITDNNLNSNSIYDIRRIDDSYLLISTGMGLSYVKNYNNELQEISFGSFNRDFVSLPRGGAPALAVKNNMVAISGIVDTNAITGLEIKGTGISYSLDFGENWEYLAQPVDSIPSTGQYHTIYWGDQDIQALSVTTEINNISYDLSISEDYIYAANWAGGIRRYGPLNGIERSWQIIPLPMDSNSELICGSINHNFEINPNDPRNGGNHNHKGFSVLVLNDTIWAGTADGVNKGIIESNCINWIKHSTSDFTSGNISGNWVIGFHNQKLNEIDDRLWAITWAGSGVNEKNALSFTDDGGENWIITSPSGTFDKVYNLYSHQNKIWAASALGLYLSLDGEHWEKYSDKKIDSITGEQILAESVLTTYFDNEWLWFGTPDGLGVIKNDNISMNVHRYWENDELFSAYPNPFLIDEHNQFNGNGHVRFIYDNLDNSSSKIDIFDFAMERVIQLNDYKIINENETEIIWNGKNEYGDKVSNGIYFCRLSIDNNYFWTKLAIIKSN